MEFLSQVMEQQEVPKTSPLHLLFLAKFYPEVCINWYLNSICCWLFLDILSISQLNLIWLWKCCWTGRERGAGSRNHPTSFLPSGKVILTKIPFTLYHHHKSRWSSQSWTWRSIAPLRPACSSPAMRFRFWKLQRQTSKFAWCRFMCRLSTATTMRALTNQDYLPMKSCSLKGWAESLSLSLSAERIG